MSVSTTTLKGRLTTDGHSKKMAKQEDAVVSEIDIVTEHQFKDLLN